MALSTYGELKQSIIQWSHRGDMDLLIDDFIKLAETEMYQNNDDHESLEIRGQETTATGTLSGRTLALPTDYLSLRSFRLTGATGRDLLPKSPDSIYHRTGTGQPKYFAISSVIEFDITPDSGYEYELIYYAKPTPLSTSNTTNEVLTGHPNIYLFGALYQLFTHADDEQQATKYLRRFSQAIDGANNTDEWGRYGNAPYARPTGPTP